MGVAVEDDRGAQDVRSVAEGRYGDTEWVVPGFSAGKAEEDLVERPLTICGLGDERRMERGSRVLPLVRSW